MKTRIHIHRESISGNAGRKTFIVTLPRDVESVVEIRVTTIGLKKNNGLNHFEAGNLRMIRDGVLLYEQQVRNENRNAAFEFEPISTVLNQGSKPVAGRKNNAHSVNFQGSPRTLFCRYDGNKSIGSLPYGLCIYFIYAKKQKP